MTVNHTFNYSRPGWQLCGPFRVHFNEPVPMMINLKIATICNTMIISGWWFEPL